MPIPLTVGGLLPAMNMVVVQYNYQDGTRDFEVKSPGDPLDYRDFDGPGADAWLLMGGDQVRVFVQHGINDEICYMIRNEGGEVVKRRWLEEHKASA